MAGSTGLVGLGGVLGENLQSELLAPPLLKSSELLCVSGKHVILHVFPACTDVSQALVKHTNIFSLVYLHL